MALYDNTRLSRTVKDLAEDLANRIKNWNNKYKKPWYYRGNECWSMPAGFIEVDGELAEVTIRVAMKRRDWITNPEHWL